LAVWIGIGVVIGILLGLYGLFLGPINLRRREHGATGPLERLRITFFTIALGAILGGVVAYLLYLIAIMI